jgi:chitinase
VGLTFNSSTVPLNFGPQVYTPTITYFANGPVSGDFFTFSQSDVNSIGLIGDPPTVTLTDSFFPEPISGTLDMPFIVSLSNTSFYNLSVNYTTTNGTAEDGLDYLGGTGNITIPSGDLFGVINIPVLEDDLIEGTETFTLTIGEVTNAIVADNLAVGTILDSDLPFEINILDSAMYESLPIPMPFAVYIPYTSTETITVDFITSNGSADENMDYVPISGTVTILPGETYQIINVEILDDFLPEVDETLFVTLSNPVGAPLGPEYIAEGIIFDDDRTSEVFLPVVVR